MKVLVVAATAQEILPLQNVVKQGELNVDVIITGVGMVATAFALGKAFANANYDLVINAGIAGAFDRSLNLGSVVNVQTDRLIELGAEDIDSFISIDEMGFGKSSFESSFQHSFLNSLTLVSAITVNKVHGNAQSIANIQAYAKAQIESMEGAAFFFACKNANLPGVQLRSISNFVEPRNRNNWDIPLAVTNLNNVLVQFIKQL